MNVSDGVVFQQPETEDERAAIAQACALHLSFEMPMLLDDASDQVDGKYIALPERLFTIDAAGIITWRSDIGPWGFDVEAWAGAIGALTASPAATAQA